MRPFVIKESKSVGEAQAALTELGEAASVYTGGTELLLVMKQGFARPEQLVDVKTIPELTELREVAGRVRLGAAVTHRTAELSPIVREKLPLLSEVEYNVANIRVRNVGTIGGNLCFAEPHSDLALVSILLDATMNTSKRSVPATEFVRGAYETCLEPGEILVSIDFPVIGHRTACGYQRFQFHERPSCAAGVVLTASADGKTCEAVRVGIGAAGPQPKRVPEGEAMFQGKTWDEILSSAREAGKKGAAISDPIADLTGSKEYKAHLVEVFIERATKQAVERLRSKGVAK